MAFHGLYHQKKATESHFYSSGRGVGSDSAPHKEKMATCRVWPFAFPCLPEPPSGMGREGTQFLTVGNC